MIGRGAGRPRSRLERARREFERYHRRERRRWRAALRAARDTYTREGERIDSERAHAEPSAVLTRVRDEERRARRVLLANRDERVAHATDPTVAVFALVLAIVTMAGTVTGWVVAASMHHGPPLDGWPAAVVLALVVVSIIPSGVAVRWAAHAHEQRRTQLGRTTAITRLREEYDAAFRALAEVEERQGVRGVAEVICPRGPADIGDGQTPADVLYAVPFPQHIEHEAAMLEAGDPRTVQRHDLARDLYTHPRSVHVPGTVTAWSGDEPPNAVGACGVALATVDGLVSR